MHESFKKFHYKENYFDKEDLVNGRLVTFLLIPLSILIFVIFAPIMLRHLTPVDPFDKTLRTSKACFGIVIPQDVTPFIMTEKISFLDARAENQKKCFGFDLYY